jgi:hypothetical protein
VGTAVRGKRAVKKVNPPVTPADVFTATLFWLLLARGADPNASNGEPYKLARHTRRDDILRALLENGAMAVLGEPVTRSSSELTSLPTAHATDVSEDDKEN